MKKLKTKNEMLRTQKKRSSNKVHGISPETGRESMVGKICERGIGLEPGVKELLMLTDREGCDIISLLFVQLVPVL